MDAGGEDYVLNMDKMQIVSVEMFRSIPIKSKYLIALDTAPPNDHQPILNLGVNRTNCNIVVRKGDIRKQDLPF
jgi:hypothetical protein